MDWQVRCQTSEEVGPGKYLRLKNYACEPSVVPFGSRRPRFQWSRAQEVLPAEQHREQALEAVEQGRQSEFEEEAHRALELWLARFKLNMADSVVFSLKVQNLDFANLTANDSLSTAFEERLKEAVAFHVGDGMLSADVNLALSAGSAIGWTIIVQCTLIPPRGIRASAVAARVASTAFGEAIAASLASMEGIQEVSTGPWPLTVGSFGAPKLMLVRVGCNTLMRGPGAPESCSQCGGRHFWLCCCCGIVQYEEQCASGCKSGEFGWVCINSTCRDATTVENASVTCGCWRGATYHISKRDDR